MAVDPSQLFTTVFDFGEVEETIVTVNDSFLFTWTFHTKGDPTDLVDFSGYAFAGSVFDENDVVVQAFTFNTPAADGVISASYAELVLAVANANYRYEIQVTNTPVKKTLLKGRFPVFAEKQTP